MINPHPVLPEFEYIRPENVKEAVRFLKEHPEESRPYMGGTDCLAAIRDRKYLPKYLVDLKHLKDLDLLSYDREMGLTIGAAVSLNRLIDSPEVKKDYPLIADAAREVGGYQLRTRATLTGNICNASPCGDTIGPCLVYQGVLSVIGPEGTSNVPLEGFFRGPGMTILNPGKIVQSITLPIPPSGSQGVYLSIGRNALSDLAIAAVTVLGFPDKGSKSGYQFRIALSAVAPLVIFAEQAQKLLANQHINQDVFEKAAELAAQACKPIDDIRASARYRREMVRTLTQQALEKVWLILQSEYGKGDQDG